MPSLRHWLYLILLGAVAFAWALSTREPIGVTAQPRATDTPRSESTSSPTFKIVRPPDAEKSTPVKSEFIDVINGDTIRVTAELQLVGLDTPEAGALAKCDKERTLAAKARARLRELIAQGELVLQNVPCACTPGTESTQECNHGRLCAKLMIDGRDVAETMISEGLAARSVCSGTGCPPRRNWC